MDVDVDVDVDVKAPNSDPIELARQNWVAAGWADAADGMALVTTIMRVQQLLLAEIESTLRPFGLTFARFELLRLLAFTRRGELPAGKIGERLQIHPASVTSAVQRLVEAGLADRRANPADGRGVLVAITPRGRDLVERCTELLNAGVFAPLSIDGDQHDVVTSSLRTLRQSLGDLQI